MQVNINEIAKMIDHSVLNPSYTDRDLKANCEIALKYHTAAVCVKPYHTKMASDILKGSGVAVCTVVGFPHGNSTIEIKTVEAVQAIKDGAAEIDMVINIGKVIQEEWEYIDLELNIMRTACHKYNALLKVIFETDLVTKDEHKIKLCELCSKNKVDFVKTSTGFGYVKGSDGKFSYTGATEHDIALMRKHSSSEVRIKASGGIRTLDQVLKMRELGAARIGATATAEIMEEANKRFKL